MWWWCGGGAEMRRQAASADQKRKGKARWILLLLIVVVLQKWIKKSIESPFEMMCDVWCVMCDGKGGTDQEDCVVFVMLWMREELWDSCALSPSHKVFHPSHSDHQQFFPLSLNSLCTWVVLLWHVVLFWRYADHRPPPQKPSKPQTLCCFFERNNFTCNSFDCQMLYNIYLNVPNWTWLHRQKSVW